MQRRQVLAMGLAAASLTTAARAADAGDVTRRFAETLNARDIDAFAALFAETYENHQTSVAAPSPSGKSAKRATAAFFAARLDALPDLKVTIESALAEGDRAAASFVWEGTHQGMYYGVPATGRRLRFTSCDIFRVAEGRIVEHWGMGDIAGVLKQLRG